MSSSIACSSFPALCVEPVNKKEIGGSLAGKKVDFAIAYSWAERARDITVIVLKILILPWGIIEGVRYLLGRVAMAMIYPAQSDLVKRYYTDFQAENTDQARLQVFQNLQAKQYAVKHLILEKRGVRYSALIAGHQDYLSNGNWALQAVGNGGTAEAYLKHYADIYKAKKQNVLIVNGPSVGRSQGTAVPSTIGDAQEVGICFLEEVIKAKSITIAGYSLGGAAVGQAILQHRFKKGIDYTVERNMTFDTLSNIVYSIVSRASQSSFLGYMAAGLIHFCGLQIDSVAASKKLQELNIQEIIIGATNYLSVRPTFSFRQEFISSTNTVSKTSELFRNDGVIPGEASLGNALVTQNITAHKSFIGLIGAVHSDEYQLV